MRDAEKFKQIENLPDRSNVRVLFLAGGKGSRLGELTQNTPKPLLPIIIGGAVKIQMIDWGLYTLPINIHNITLITDSEEKIKQYYEHLDDLVDPDIRRIELFEENSPEGTAGAVSSFVISESPNEDVLIISPADTMFPFSKMNEIVDDFEKGGANICWCVTSNPGENAQNTGKVIVDGEQIIGSLESIPGSVGVDGGLTSVGVVIVNKEYYRNKYQLYLNQNPKKEKVDMYRDFIPWLIDQGEKVNYFDIRQPATDLGTRERYATVS